MSFHLGKPILVMLAISLISGTAILLRPNEPKGSLTLWTFAKPHADTYNEIIPQFEAQHQVKVRLDVLAFSALGIRLSSMFMSDLEDIEVPDVVEVHIGQIGRYFRPPVDDVGFLPLDDYLKKGGWEDRILKSRLAPWSKDGHVFGVPHDVHPVALSYRDDLYREAGIDLSTVKTWREFHEKALQFREYWRQRGKNRYAIELNRAAGDQLTMLLLQRGINLIDEHGKVQFTDPRVASTIALYASMVAGPKQVANESAGGRGTWAQDLIDGNICAYITADWRTAELRDYASGAAGKMKMMPLPVFEIGDTPTSTWGGTMIAIPRRAKNPDLSWKLIEHLYLSPEGNAARLKTSNILPPVRELWKDDRYDRPDPYFSNQHVDQLFIKLAERIPPRIVTPGDLVAQSTLAYVVSMAVSHAEQHGDADLEAKCSQWLKQAQDDLEKRMEHWKF